MNLEIPAWIAGLLACGMGVALLGSVKITLAQRLQMDEARVGGLVSMFGFATIPVMLNLRKRSASCFRVSVLVCLSVSGCLARREQRELNLEMNGIKG